MRTVQIWSITAAVLVVIVASMRYLINDDSYLSSARLAQINIATVQAVGMVLWPLTWGALIGTDTLSTMPVAAIGLCWPLVLMTLDLLWIAHQTASHEGVNKKTVFHFDSGAVQGLAFGIGGLLVSNLGARFAKSVSPVFSVCILVCIAVLLPSPGVQASTLNSITIGAIQKVALTYCIGLLISTLSMNLHFCTHVSTSPAEAMRQAMDEAVSSATASSAGRR